MLDPTRYYDLEGYVFDVVHHRFHEDGSIGAFDFFSIVIWKANRAKSTIARRLLQRDRLHRLQLEPIVRDITKALFAASGARERLQVLVEDWGFRLPMASAILSVFWPDELSVYDVRVCEQLQGFHGLQNRTDFSSLWSGYQEYIAAVQQAVPSTLSLRDKDRYLWASSVAEQLQRDIAVNFGSDDSA
jgi:hypothetical protein